jgi:hypothetical protein
MPVSENQYSIRHRARVAAQRFGPASASLLALVLLCGSAAGDIPTGIGRLATTADPNNQTYIGVNNPSAITDIVSSESGPNPFAGLTINFVVGAGSFYNYGFYGGNSIVANVEAGHIWNGHETLGHVTTFVQDTVSPGPQTGEFDRHATWVGAVIGGRPANPFPGDYQVGIAPLATLWSGSIATNWIGSPYAGGFDFNLDTFANPYKQIMVTGVGGQTADVVNSSWGFDNTTGAGDDFSRGIDALVYLSGKTFTTVAGNSGPGANTVGTPAAAYNKIAVGGLASDTSSPPYSTVASFSSRGPSDVLIPVTNQVIVGARATVDLVAPAQNLTLAYYGGNTGGNSPTLGTPQNSSPANNLYAIDVAGTSFAGPMVAGGAALMDDAAKFVFGTSSKALDGRVVKAILQTSATKLTGWDNGLALNGSGVLETKQSLDYASGAGAMNLDSALNVEFFGTTDVPGLGGGNVQQLGWDYGRVHAGSSNDYRITTAVPGGKLLDVTLDWFINRTIDLTTNATAENIFNNLDLEVWHTIGGVPTDLVATSDSQYNNVEHLFFLVPTTGEFLIRVTFAGTNWNLSDTPSSLLDEDYGLAWAVVVPEPGSATLLVVGLAAAACKFYRRR